MASLRASLKNHQGHRVATFERETSSACGEPLQKIAQRESHKQQSVLNTSEQVGVKLTTDLARYVRVGDRSLQLAAMLGVTQASTTYGVQTKVVINKYPYAVLALQPRIPICREWESRMKYELPKSYAKRTAANASPHSIMSHSSPRPPAEFRPRTARPPAPQSSTTGSVGTTRPQASSNATPSFQPQLHSGTNTVSASTYQRLLVELKSRQQENERLKQVTHQLLVQVSDLQTKYAQALASVPPTGQSGVREPLPKKNSQPTAARQAIGKALTKMSVFDRLRQPHRGDSKSPDTSRSTTPLPELSVLNRLRQTKRPTSSPSRDITPSGTTSSENRAIPVASASPSSPPSPNTTAQQLQNRSQFDNPAEFAGSPALSLVSPLADDERMMEELGYSPYQKARQEQTQTTPLWMWLLAWLLLLPISAGLGYTFVQWVMNPGTPANSPPPIEQAE